MIDESHCCRGTSSAHYMLNIYNIYETSNIRILKYAILLSDDVLQIVLKK